MLGDLRQSAIEMDKVLAACPGADIHHDVVVQGWPEGKLSLARGVRVEKGSILALGDELNGYGALEVGTNTWIGQYNNFRLSHGTHISIGKGCLISQFCTLVAANHRIDRSTPLQQSPCDLSKANIEIGDDVWLGAGAAIMPSVNIGTGAVVGANSVVTLSIPEYEIWAGAPAHKIGERV
jgi:acetyltransferase-like isoleucine patch superfamily enzyme